MNRKQLTILLVLVVVLGIAGLVVYNKQNQERRGGNPSLGKKLLVDLPVNDVGLLSIKQGTNEVTLAKKKDDVWRVRERNDYPANYQEISDFLLKARDLKAVQSEEVGTSQLPKLALVPGQGSNAATVVEFKDGGGKTLASLLLGKKHMRKSNRPSPMGDMGDEGWPDGRYLKVGDSRNVALVSEVLASIEPKPEQWLNKDFCKIEKPRSVAVEFSNATNSWALSRETETGEWKLADPKPGEQLDAGKASSATSSLSSPSFSDVSPAAKADEFGLAKPTIARISTFDGFDYTLKVGQKTNDSYPVMVAVVAKIASERTPGKDEKPEDKQKLDKEFKDKQQKLEEKLAQEKSYENWVYFVSSWSVDSLLKERSQLLVEKKEEPKKTDASASGSSTNAVEKTEDAPLGASPLDDKK